MKTRTLKWFDSLQRRDFDNQAVLDEIRAVFKERDNLHAELNTPGPKESRRAMIARRRETGGHWGFTLIELLVVIAIVAIVAAMFMPMLTGSATGSKVGVVTSIEKRGKRWVCELSQQGVRIVQSGKVSHAEANITRFSIPATDQGNRMAEKIQNYQGHVLRIKYHRTGMKWDVESVDDLGLAEQP